MQFSEAQDSSISFLKIYLNLAYYAGLWPFRLVTLQNRDNGKISVSLKSFLPQKILCATLSFLVYFWHARLQLTVPVFTQDLNRPGTFFEIAFVTVELVQKLRILKHFWWNQQDFLSIFSQILDDSVASDIQYKMHIPKPKLILTYMPYIIVCFLELIFAKGGFGFIQVSDLSFERWWNSVGCMARSVSFFRVESLNGEVSCGNSFLDTIVTLVGALVLFYR